MKRRDFLQTSGLLSANLVTADPVAAVQVLREGGCGGLLPAAQPLHHNSLLDRAAEQWAAGGTVQLENADTWGLADENLDERILSDATWSAPATRTAS